MTSDGWTTGMAGAQGGRPPGRGGGLADGRAFGAVAPGAGVL